MRIDIRDLIVGVFGGEEVGGYGVEEELEMYGLAVALIVGM